MPWHVICTHDGKMEQSVSKSIRNVQERQRPSETMQEGKPKLGTDGHNYCTAEEDQALAGLKFRLSMSSRLSLPQLSTCRSLVTIGSS